MYSAIDLITLAIQKINQEWERYKPRNCSEIEILVQKREKDAKLIALNELLTLLNKRDSMPILTKENTEVKWMPCDDDNRYPYAIIQSGDFELIFNRIDAISASIRNSNDYFTDITFHKEGDFARHNFDGSAPAFFIEITLLNQLSELADKFMECEECGNTLNECECCCECGKYECECEHECEYCGESDCYGECRDE